MVRLFKKFMIVAKSFKNPRQTTWVYCPGCKVDLISSHHREMVDDGYVNYYCLLCHFYSVWDFDTPAPILINWYYMNHNDWEKEHTNDATEAG